MQNYTSQEISTRSSKRSSNAGRSTFRTWNMIGRGERWGTQDARGTKKKKGKRSKRRSRKTRRASSESGTDRADARARSAVVWEISARTKNASAVGTETRRDLYLLAALYEEWSLRTGRCAPATVGSLAERMQVRARQSVARSPLDASAPPPAIPSSLSPSSSSSSSSSPLPPPSLPPPSLCRRRYVVVVVIVVIIVVVIIIVDVAIARILPEIARGLPRSTSAGCPLTMANKVARGRKARYRWHLSPSRFGTPLSSFLLSCLALVLPSFSRRLNLCSYACISTSFSFPGPFPPRASRSFFSFSPFVSFPFSFLHCALLSNPPPRSFDCLRLSFPTIRLNSYIYMIARTCERASVAILRESLAFSYFLRRLISRIMFDWSIWCWSRYCTSGIHRLGIPRYDSFSLRSRTAVCSIMYFEDCVIRLDKETHHREVKSKRNSWWEKGKLPKIIHWVVVV